MAYFQNFPIIEYNFGDEVNANAFQNISAYVDIIDRVKDDAAYYQYYTILNKERPDWLSYKLYGDVRFYWTFYALNDNLRRQSWPIDYNDVVKKAKVDYPNQTAVTRDLIHDKMLKNSTVTGSTSGAVGTVLRRNLDLGQIVIKAQSGTFLAGEVLTDDASNSITLVSAADEHLSAHHYENADGDTVDFDPTVGPGVILTEVTYLDRLVSANDSVKEIKIIRPDIINDLELAHQEALAG
jgi:hypothetical protein